MILIGAGGHAKVVFDALEAGGYNMSELQLRADKSAPFMGRPVSTPEVLPEIKDMDCHVAIGSNEIRHKLIRDLGEVHGRLRSIRHPRATVSAHARIGDGCFVAAHACVSTDAQLGRGVIVNHGAVVEHDCVIGDAVHVAPGAILGGGVKIGDLVLVGANATVLPGLAVGAGAIIGAGAVVTKNVPEGGVWIGTALARKE
ncbi:MAG: NeuD/PglB/VioB family sugar acetyltransferase [Paracoccaceae bacterium]